MTKQSRYHSTKRTAFLDCIKSFSTPFTIKELELALYQKNTNLGKSTIYRNVEELLQNGVLLKTIDTDGLTKYRYVKKCTNHNHFNLECSKCHKTFHLDCNHFNSLAKHLYDNHDFIINTSKLFLTGVCTECNNDKN